MLKRDYIMKLIQQLMDSIFLLLNKQDVDDIYRRKQLEKFYSDYVGQSAEFYLSTSIDKISNFLEDKYGKEEVLFRIEMLSEIMYQDGMLEIDIDKKELKLLKDLSLLEYIEENSNTYSLVRMGKINEIKSIFRG